LAFPVSNALRALSATADSTSLPPPPVPPLAPLLDWLREDEGSAAIFNKLSRFPDTLSK